MSSAKSVKFKFCFYIVTVQTSYEQAQRLLLHYFSRHAREIYDRCELIQKLFLFTVDSSGILCYHPY